MLTGRYDWRTGKEYGVLGVRSSLHINKERATLASLLKNAGYHTAAIGKWSLGNPGSWGVANYQGFDYFFGTPTSNDRVANLFRNEELIEPKSNMATLTKRYTDEAIDFIAKHKEQPFFVYIPHTMPHTRLDASPQFKGKSKRGLYGDVIEEIDDSTGRIVDLVRELELDQQTILVWTHLCHQVGTTAELDRFERGVSRIAAAGVDAVLVQDLGVARLISSASTTL